MNDPSAETPIKSVDDLESVFHRAHKPPSGWLIGAEAEKFCVDADTCAPLPYTGERSVLAIFERLVQRHGWTPWYEHGDGPLIALTRERSSVTLEPGAQVELSGSPLPDVHAVALELRGHLGELRALSDELNLCWLSLGFHPTARPEDIPWVPKERYPIMRRFLPTKGSRALDMMQRTCTVQANFDYESEDDALDKLVVMQRLAPVIQAMSANAPFKEGRVSPLKSERADVWLHMDPARSGIVARLWARERPRYRDYVEWALDAGMFLFRRNGRVFHNTGQTFRSFWQDGFEGERPTLGDWITHLGTLFPEVRLKSTLEVRSADAQSEPLSLALVALFAGVLYDADALAAAKQLARGFDLEVVRAARALVPREGLATRVGALSLRESAERLIEIARGGLERRGRKDAGGRDESAYLVPLEQLVASGRCPADVLRSGLEVGAPIDHAIVHRAELESTRRVGARPSAAE